LFVHFKATQELVTRVPQATQAELNEATKSAASAFKEWKKTTVLTRQRKMLDLQDAIKDNMVGLCNAPLLLKVSDFRRITWQRALLLNKEKRLQMPRAMFFVDFVSNDNRYLRLTSDTLDM
jgi:hypothetical protein